MLNFSYGVPLVPSVDPPMVPISSYSTLQTSSVIPSSAPTFKYGVHISGVLPSSMLPPLMKSHPTKFTMLFKFPSIVLYSKDQYRFDKSLIWVHPNSLAL